MTTKIPKLAIGMIPAIITMLIVMSNTQAFSIPGISVEKVKEGQQLKVFASDIGKYSLFDYLCED